jgi:hypothetical protein
MISERGFASLHIPGVTWKSKKRQSPIPGVTWHQKNDHSLKGLGYFSLFLLSESSKGCQTLATCEEYQPACAVDADPIKKADTNVIEDRYRPSH